MTTGRPAGRISYHEPAGSAASIVTRRSAMAGIALVAAVPAIAPTKTRSSIEIIAAPSALGLVPPRKGHEPGTWCAPRALMAAGLTVRLGANRVTNLGHPAYSFEAEAEVGTRIRNGRKLRRFSEALGSTVAAAIARGRFPLVVGGDCSIILGCLHGARAGGEIGLVHIDGHSDFYHPGNYDSRKVQGSAAGMDLALATGRGEALLARWDGRPLVQDDNVVQIGERNELEPDFDYRDIRQTAIRQLPIRSVIRDGIERTVRHSLAPMHGANPPLWVHVDLDVVSDREITAVDSPGHPGLSFPQLATLLRGLLESGRILGLDVAIYDPELDPQRIQAARIVDCLAHAFAGFHGAPLL
jgi:arginase